MDRRETDVLGSLYAAIDDDQAFADLPRLLSGYIASNSGWIVKRRFAQTTVEAAYNLGTAHLAAYEDYYRDIDPFTEQISKVPMASAISFERLVPRQEYHRSEFFNDYVRPNRLGQDVIGACFELGDTMIATTFHRTGAEPFGPADEARLQAIVPHLQRVLASRAALSMDSAARLSEALFQNANDAVLLCDPAQRVVHLNRAARGLPIACAVIGRSGQLAFASPVAQRSFVAAIEQAARQRSVTSFAVPRMNKLPYRVTADGNCTSTPTVVVTIVDLERQLRERIDRAQRLFVFTPSECALAESLLRGRTAEEHATLRGTALSTVRSQLHLMLAKSKTARQAELIAVLTQL